MHRLVQGDEKIMKRKVNLIEANWEATNPGRALRLVSGMACLERRAMTAFWRRL